MEPTISFGNFNSAFQIGVNTGQINIAEQLETPPDPLSTVRFGPDSDFVDDGGYLSTIYQRSALPASRMALVGIGGIGKSKLAIEYSYRIREESPTTWVFWVHASNSARLEKDFRDIADLVKIPGRKESRADPVKLVSNWLVTMKSGKWVLIFDNVDDDFLYESPSAHSCQNKALGQRLSSLIPRSTNGSILVTSRSYDVARKFIQEKDILFIEPMARPAAEMLIRQKLGLQYSTVGEQEISHLAAALEFMPLAIVQATSYIRNRGPRSSLSQYLEKFRTSDRKKKALLCHEAGHLHRDGDARNAILATWQISFDHIRQLRPSSTNLLSLMSFFDGQGIPEYVINGQLEAPVEKCTTRPISDEQGDSTSVSSAEDGFEDDVQILRDYRFISLDENGTIFEMHSLVQLAMRSWLENHGVLEDWKRKFIKALAGAFPSEPLGNQARCQSLFPHVMLALKYKFKCHQSLEDFGSLLYNAASYVGYWKRNVTDTESLARASIKARKSVFAPDDPRTLASVSMLMLAYQNGQQWQKLEMLSKKVLATCKRVLAMEHDVSLDAMRFLAVSCAGQNRPEECETLLRQALAIHALAPGQVEETFNCASSLLAILNIRGQSQKAESLGESMVDFGRSILGPEHPELLRLKACLAETYRHNGRLREAEKLITETSLYERQTLGPEHPRTLASLGILASLYRDQSRYKESEAILLELLAVHKRSLGRHHWYTLKTTLSLSYLYRCQKQWGKSIVLLENLLETQSLGSSEVNPQALIGMCDLADNYYQQSRWIEAEELFVRALDLHRRGLGKNLSPKHVMSALALVYYRQGKIKEAVRMHVESGGIFHILGRIQLHIH